MIQSMTNTQTTDIDGTVNQVRTLANGGAALVRIAVPDERSLNVLPSIRKSLRVHGCSVPLIADIHFSRHIALKAIETMEKIRINPGNLLEAPRGRAGVASPSVRQRVSQSEEELVRIFDAASSHGRSMRIGVNQGSLSKRIVEESGDGADAMVRSAMEYVGVAERVGYTRLVISLKSSDPWTVVNSHRLLADQNIPFPFHVGVTEAGWGIQGLARSAAGIGILVREGLVDTLRVSLAEEPLREIPVARALAASTRRLLPRIENPRRKDPRGIQVGPTGGSIHESFAGRGRLPAGDGGDGAGRIVQAGQSVGKIWDLDGSTESKIGSGDFVRISDIPDSPGDLARRVRDLILQADFLTEIAAVQLPLPGMKSGGASELAAAIGDLGAPLIWEMKISSDEHMMNALTDVAELYEHGFMDWLEIGGTKPSNELERAGLDILQGMGTGSWRADIIACPQCGRNRIDVPELTRLVRDEFGHMRGLKFAVMGCIVNGPGEMRDADFGLLGQGDGKVTLYVHGLEAERDIPIQNAMDRMREVVMGWRGEASG